MKTMEVGPNLSGMRATVTARTSENLLMNPRSLPTSALSVCGNQGLAERFRMLAVRCLRRLVRDRCVRCAHPYLRGGHRLQESIHWQTLATFVVLCSDLPAR